MSKRKDTHRRTYKQLDCRSVKAKLAKVRHAARLFLMWFEKDGEPVDGFRFRQQFHALSKAVGFPLWLKRLKLRVRGQWQLFTEHYHHPAYRGLGGAIE